MIILNNSLIFQRMCMIFLMNSMFSHRNIILVKEFEDCMRIFMNFLEEFHDVLWEFYNVLQEFASIPIGIQ